VEAALMDQSGDLAEVIIGEKCFTICTEPEQHWLTGEHNGLWNAWCFFAYDSSIEIYPAGGVPNGVNAQESIVGESGVSVNDAIEKVIEKLTAIIGTRSLEGTGFYSPPAGRIYPQEFGKE
jgi:hypothetical protein